MQNLTEQIREAMLRAWDGVHNLEATARRAYFKANDVPPRRRFLQPQDVHDSIHYYHAWWEAPDHWRLDQTLLSGTALRYVSVGDDWALWRNGLLHKRGSIATARQSLPTRGEDLIFGRPYLSPFENALLWAWLNPMLWAVSCGLFVDQGYQPTSDDILADSDVVHVLASQSWAHGSIDADRARQYKSMRLADFDRDMDIGEGVNFWRLWVDKQTGFLRRVTGESANGRQWDIIVDYLEINQSSDPGIFSGLRTSEGS